MNSIIKKSFTCSLFIVLIYSTLGYFVTIFKLNNVHLYILMPTLTITFYVCYHFIKKNNYNLIQSIYLLLPVFILFTITLIIRQKVDFSISAFSLIVYPIMFIIIPVFSYYYFINQKIIIPILLIIMIFFINILFFQK